MAYAGSRMEERDNTVRKYKYRTMRAGRVRLQHWAELTFGQFAPPYTTLRRWALNGSIVPAPEKIGHAWFVELHAVYRDRLQPDTVYLSERI